MEILYIIVAVFAVLLCVAISVAIVLAAGLLSIIIFKEIIDMWKE